MRQVARLLALAASVALTVGGCSGDDGGASPQGDPSDAFEVGERYVRSLSEGVDGIDTAVDLAAEGSVAERYAVHTKAVRDIQADAGEDPEQPVIAVEGDAIILTFPVDGDDPIRTTWAGFAVDDDGMLTDFTIDGADLGDRLVAPGQPAISDLISARVVSGFRLVTSDSLVVVVEVENRSDTDFGLGGATYQPPDGEPRTTAPSGAGLVVPAGADNRAVLIFESSELGGTLVLDGETDRVVTIELPLAT